MATIPEYRDEKATPASPATAAQQQVPTSPAITTSTKQDKGKERSTQPDILRLHLSCLPIVFIYAFWLLISTPDGMSGSKEEDRASLARGCIVTIVVTWILFSQDNRDFFPPAAPPPQKQDTLHYYFVQALWPSLGWAFLLPQAVEIGNIVYKLCHRQELGGRIQNWLIMPIIAWVTTPIIMMWKGAPLKTSAHAFAMSPWWLVRGLYSLTMIRHRFTLHLLQRLWLGEAVVSVELSVFGPSLSDNYKTTVQDKESEAK